MGYEPFRVRVQFRESEGLYMTESKYPVGQELWTVTVGIIKSCPKCGEILVKKLYVKYCGEIKGYKTIGDTEYYDMGKFLIACQFSDVHYFTTRELAQAECDRRNKGGEEK